MYHFAVPPYFLRLLFCLIWEIGLGYNAGIRKHNEQIRADLDERPYDCNYAERAEALFGIDLPCGEVVQHSEDDDGEDAAQV